jgi:hypothetical protein
VSLQRTFEPLPRTRRGWIALVVTGILLVIAFVLVVRFYDVEGGSTVSGADTEVTGQEAIFITVEPAAVDANANETRVHLSFRPVGDDYVGSDSRLTRNVRITVSDVNGVTEYKFPAGTFLTQRDQVLVMDGETAAYPFDLHSAKLLFAADTYTRNSDGSFASDGQIPIGLEGEGGVNGWDTNIDLFGDLSQDQLASGVPAMALLTYTRAFSTQVFAMLILAIAGVLALLALGTAALVQADRRPAEAALLSWTAALLFALPALRNYLPNGPPFGASIDMYAYLWFMLAAGAAAVLVIVGWNGQKLAERRRLKAQAQRDQDERDQEERDQDRQGAPHGA